MRKTRWILAGCAALLLASCGSKPQDLIVGKWEPTDASDKWNIEFTKDGSMIAMVGPMTVKGTYRFLDDKNIEVNLAAGGPEIDMSRMRVDTPEPNPAVLNPLLRALFKKKIGVSVTKDELTATDQEGNTTKLKRVK